MSSPSHVERPLLSGQGPNADVIPAWLSHLSSTDCVQTEKTRAKGQPYAPGTGSCTEPGQMIGHMRRLLLDSQFLSRVLGEFRQTLFIQGLAVLSLVKGEHMEISQSWAGSRSQSCKMELLSDFSLECRRLPSPFMDATRQNAELEHPSLSCLRIWSANFPSCDQRTCRCKDGPKTHTQGFCNMTLHLCQ